jgi:hypothetical protein
MIVRDLDVMGVAIFPDEANPELVVDRNRVLAGAIASQSMKSIARWSFEVFEAEGAVQHAEFAAGCREKVGRKALWVPAIEDGLGGFVLETADHARSPTAGTIVSLNDTFATVRWQSSPIGSLIVHALFGMTTRSLARVAPARWAALRRNILNAGALLAWAQSRGEI